MYLIHRQYKSCIQILALSLPEETGFSLVGSLATVYDTIWLFSFLNIQYYHVYSYYPFHFWLGYAIAASLGLWAMYLSPKKHWFTWCLYVFMLLYRSRFVYPNSVTDYAFVITQNYNELRHATYNAPDRAK